MSRRCGGGGRRWLIREGDDMLQRDSLDIGSDEGLVETGKGPEEATPYCMGDKMVSGCGMSVAQPVEKIQKNESVGPYKACEDGKTIGPIQTKHACGGWASLDYDSNDLKLTLGGWVTSADGYTISSTDLGDRQASRGEMRINQRLGEFVWRYVRDWPASDLRD
ncbi:hypothetical protein L1987_10112 [Smallanthus sonchifolius]|uniref:Uncharacterized protein n=1 Tax=Smallanthus sonchifolius TaxID=185202 RepID=A0ACB9JR59_9ASTR|nr:hypothetical protein L1987_10112 [Smallanthus sonchifolius]